MFRPGASRTALRSLNASFQPTFRAVNSPMRSHFKSQLCTVARRPQASALAKPLASEMLVARFADERKPGQYDAVDSKHEAAIRGNTITPHPELVSTASSTHPVRGEIGAQEVEKDTDMMAGVRSDMQTIRDTFSLEGVPRQAYYIGLAGVLPYAATSAATVYSAWEIHNGGYLMTEKTAELVLQILEPLQVGYGATIISFLGAIHWGLEWAKYGGEQGYPRYSIGVISTALAWPTILLPVEYALISQFLIFNFLYYTDSRASKKGWAPGWYGVYRFVLTFIVGASIVVSLIGRGQVSDRVGRLPGPADRVRQLREQQAVEAENEEEARRNFLASKDGEGGDEE
ncbi:hypothetical protein AC579_3728 [Pseudocercospora musae]|uniref:Mitochondrial inner membrane protein 1 n=1 Tax=Pseudocercospora musae TaxID=113226 RepID=A0A139I1G2_9PEZI|nr:hypothetical protein AC579_3728 [Pseudocercospora musae]